MEWNQTEKVSESSVEQNYFAQFQLFLLCSGQVKQQEIPKGNDRVSCSGILKKVKQN